MKKIRGVTVLISVRQANPIRMKLSYTVASIGFVHTKPAAVSRKGKILCYPYLKLRRNHNEKQR